MLTAIMTWRSDIGGTGTKTPAPGAVEPDFRRPAADDTPQPACPVPDAPPGASLDAGGGTHNFLGPRPAAENV